MRDLTPDTIHPPFSDYAHGIEVRAQRLVLTSGQLGIRPDGSVPEGAQAQSEVCFENIDAILRQAGLGRDNIVRLNAFVTSRDGMQGYRVARDAYLANVATKPGSTLVIVSGFTRPEFLVEVEAFAADEG